MKIDYTSSRLYYYTSLLMILVLILMFSLENLSIHSVVIGSIWLAITISIITLFPRQKGLSKFKHLEEFHLLSFIFGFIYIVIYFGSSLILGFGKSPYARGIINVSANIYIYIIPIVAKELIRSFLLINYAKKNNLKIVFITILMIAVDISISQIFRINSPKELIMYLSQTFGPLICLNIFASYACIVADPLTSIIFLSIINIIEFISPVLPMLQWLSRGLINISIPIFSYISLSFYNDKINKSYKAYKVKKESVFSLSIISASCVLLIWFVVGVFPIFPSVVLTGSMKPVIDPGDIVVIKKIQKINDIENLKIGDVIQFKRDDILIVHRIIELVKNNNDGMTYYRTRGDNNSADDKELVNQNDIKGTVYKTIPKLGILTLLLKNNDAVPLDELEF
jgi:signal peptidase